MIRKLPLRSALRKHFGRYKLTPTNSRKRSSSSSNRSREPAFALFPTYHSDCRGAQNCSMNEPQNGLHRLAKEELLQCKNLDDFRALKHLNACIKKATSIKMAKESDVADWISSRGHVTCTRCAMRGEECKRVTDSRKIRCKACVDSTSQSARCSRMDSWKEWLIERAFDVSAEKAAELFNWVRVW